MPRPTAIKYLWAEAPTSGIQNRDEPPNIGSHLNGGVKAKACPFRAIVGQEKTRKKVARADGTTFGPSQPGVRTAGIDK